MCGHLSRRGLSPEGPRLPGPCDLPGPRRAGSSVLLGLAPDGVCPDAPRHRGAGAPLPHHFTFACARLTCGRAIGRIVSVALSRGFPRVGVTNRPCPVVSGLSSRSITPRDRMACCVKCKPPAPREQSTPPAAIDPPKWVGFRGPAGRGSPIRSAELGAAGLAAARGGHRVAADRACGVSLRDQLVPDAEDRVLQRRATRLEQGRGAPDEEASPAPGRSAARSCRVASAAILKSS